MAYLSRLAEEENLRAEIATWLREGAGAEMLSNRSLLLGAGGAVLATRLEVQVPRYGARQMLALRRAIAASR